MEHIGQRFTVFENLCIRKLFSSLEKNPDHSIHTSIFIYILNEFNSGRLDTAVWMHYLDAN